MRLLQILIGTAAGAAVGILVGLALHHGPAAAPAAPVACVTPQASTPSPDAPLNSYTQPELGQPLCRWP